MTSILGSGWPEKAAWLFSACFCPSDTKFLIFSCSKLQEQAVRWWKLSISEEHWPDINMLFTWTMLCSHWYHVYYSLRGRLGKSAVLTILLPRTFTVGPHDVRERTIVNSREGETEITVWDQEVTSRKALKMSARQSKGDCWRLTYLWRGKCTQAILCVPTHVHRGMRLQVASVMCEWVGWGEGRGEEISGRVHAQSLSCVQLFVTPRL